MLFSEKTTNDVIENWVILGRPITLQDVLFALKSYSPNVHLMLRDDEE